MNEHSASITELTRLAVEQQRQFDDMASAHTARLSRQLARRQRMRETLVAHEAAMQALFASGRDNPGESIQPTPEERAHVLNLLDQFDADAAAYAHDLQEGLRHFAAMRDILAAFMRTRDQLRALGHTAPEVIEHKESVASLQTAAFEANSRSADPGRN